MNLIYSVHDLVLHGVTTHTQNVVKAYFSCTNACQYMYMYM